MTRSEFPLCNGNGKIARLPAAIREELNKRIRDNQQSPEILPWLNGLSQTKQVLADFFDGREINIQNLSSWRLKNYKRWLESQVRRHARLEKMLTDAKDAKGPDLTEAEFEKEKTARVVALCATLTAAVNSGIAKELMDSLEMVLASQYRQNVGYSQPQH